MDVETLSKAELLMLLSILEGELEAQDLVIHTLRAQQRDAFVQERYGHYDLSDPFLALQRDSEVVQGQDRGHTQPRGRGGGGVRGQAGANPLAVLKLVMAHCRRMQEKMMEQLAAAESRHRRVIADLEEEKRRHAQDSAEGDDVTYMLEKERERLLQELEFERSRAERLERERQALSGQAQDDLAQHQQLTSALAQESQRVAQLRGQLEQERSNAQSLQGVLEAERLRALQTEARAERQLAEFDTESEQLKLKLRKEENRSRDLQETLDGMRRELENMKEREKEWRKKTEELKTEEDLAKTAEPAAAAWSSTGCQTEPVVMETLQKPQLNGHLLRQKESDSSVEEKGAENGGLENGIPALGAVPISPVHPQQSLSPSSTASSSLTSSPCSSPVLAKRLASLGSCSPTYPSSYQASVNQRFQAARHKFQQQAEQDQHHPLGMGGASVTPNSPRDLSPTATPLPPPSENSTAKQIARNTVTQVLSRFTSQAAGKLPAPNSSPFGTDYRTLASSSSSSSSPTGKGPASPLSPGIRSPVISRVERNVPPPVPPKKVGVNQSPSSPVPSSRASHFPDLSSGGCGLTSTQEGAKELDLVVSSSS